MARERVTLDSDDLRQRHASGDSVLKMARELGTSRPTIVRKLAALGLETRSASEANLLRFARATPTERRAISSAANASRRGVVDFSPRNPGRDSAMINTALRKSRKVGRGEAELSDLLVRRGLPVEVQVPISGYNLDIAVRPVAVEVWWGEGYPVRHGRQARRAVDLANLGWSVMWVWLSKRSPTSRTADAIVAFLEETSGNPLPVGPQYRVIRSDGEIVAGGKLDPDHLTLVPPTER